MIVKACDTCRQLMDTEHRCAIVAMRTKDSVVFKRGDSGGKGSNHFCGDECANTFFERWLAGTLPEVEEVVIAPQVQSSQPHEVRMPTAEEMATQSAILSSVIGR